MTEIHFTGLVLRDSTHTKVLLQKRSATKSFLPNCYSAIGGKTDPGETPIQCLQRETFEECPQINWSKLTDVRERLTLTDESYPGKRHVMHWFTGTMHEAMTDFSSTEGDLQWKPVASLPLPLETMSPAAFAAIPFILSLPTNEAVIHHASLAYKNDIPFMTFL